ncbi:MAG: hypothetical protein HQL69_22250, partial [Magnetococcales bacterium]|nr:hypothetical protein [Magnetococcales bacterium]
RHKIQFSLWRAESEDPSLRSKYPTQSVALWLRRKIDSGEKTNASREELEAILTTMEFVILQEKAGRHEVDDSGTKLVLAKEEHLRRLAELDEYEEDWTPEVGEMEQFEEFHKKFIGFWWLEGDNGAFTVVTAIERQGLCADCHINDGSNHVYFKFEKKIDDEIIALRRRIIIEIFENIGQFSVVGILLFFLRSRINDMVGRLKRREEKLENQNRELVVSMTQVQRAESEMKAARDTAENATKTKDDFLRLVSHDLRSPLTSIITTMKYIREEVDNKHIKKMVESLEKRSSRTLEMIQHLLDIDRLRKGIVLVEPVEFHGISYIADILDDFYPVAEKKGVILSNSFPANLTLYSDEKLLERVLVNLISNAIKFCNSGDTVRVSYVQGDFPIIEVQDDGIGIPEEMIPMLFMREQVTSRSGTLGEVGHGLGLPLCQDIMKSLGGRIVVFSTVGRGSRFHLQLPPYAVKEIGEEVEFNLEQEHVERITGSYDDYRQQIKLLKDKNMAKCTNDEKKMVFNFLDHDVLLQHANEEQEMVHMSFTGHKEHSESHAEYRALLDFVKSGSGVDSEVWDEDMIGALWDWLRVHSKVFDAKFIKFLK